MNIALQTLFSIASQTSFRLAMQASVKFALQTCGQAKIFLHVASLPKPCPANFRTLHDKLGESLPQDIVQTGKDIFIFINFMEIIKIININKLC